LATQIDLSPAFPFQSTLEARETDLKGEGVKGEEKRIWSLLNVINWSQLATRD